MMLKNENGKNDAFKYDDQLNNTLITSRSEKTIKENDEEIANSCVQNNVSEKKLRLANVTYLDNTTHSFFINAEEKFNNSLPFISSAQARPQKNANGDILFNMVCSNLTLKENDFFGLFFYDEQKIQIWLYMDKKICEQDQASMWTFYFGVKFFPAQPNQLSNDITRTLLCRQLQNNVYNNILPVSVVTQLKLGSLKAQAEFGDYFNNADYIKYLMNAKIVVNPTDLFVEKITEFHKEYRGITASEAEILYLNECKKLALYGVVLFSAKNTKKKSLRIGVSAHGISIFNDQMRIHRFAWPNIIKFMYRRNIFSIKLKTGELNEKKCYSISYKLVDYSSAKRLWKCAVEHHTFFRLIQPQLKIKRPLFAFQSRKFYFQGRTNFQAQMASHLFISSTKSLKKGLKPSMTSNCIKDFVEHVTPLDYSDADGKNDTVSSNAVTVGNRTIKTFTKLKKDEIGKTDNQIKHVKIINNDNGIDHKKDLDCAIMNSTNMNRRMTVKKIDIKH